MRSRYEAGEGRIGFVFWLAVFGLSVLVAVKAIPVKVADAQLVDHVVEMAQFRYRIPPDKFATEIFNKARELDIPLDKKAIKVEKFRERIRITYNYSVPLEFPGYTYVWVFDKEVDRPIFAAL